MKSKQTQRSGRTGFRYTLIAAAASAVLAQGAAAAITTTTSGVYDEQTSQLNTIDQTAAGATPVNASLVPLSQFKTDITAAYAAGTGGVIHFDDVSTATSSQQQIFARYGAGNARTLTLTNPNYNATTPAGYQVDMSAATAVAATPISGGNYLRSNGTTIHAFNFSEPLSEVGFTILARSAARTVNVRLTYDDGTTGTFGPVTVPANTGSGATSTPDTFFGFAAPTGRTISGLSIDPGASNFFVLDDLAFVTVPEPGTLGLAATAAVALLARRRRAR